MVAITIPLIPFLFAIFAFIFPAFSLIDEEDRIFAFLLSTIFSAFSFMAAYGFLSSINI